MATDQQPVKKPATKRTKRTKRIDPKRLPKNFFSLATEGDLERLIAVFDERNVDAVDPYRNDTALFFFRLPTEVVRFLIDRGADVNARNDVGQTPLHSQLYGANLELFIASGADVHAAARGGETPLHFAARAGHTVAIEPLVRAGADLEARTRDGRTPLDEALRSVSDSNVVRTAETVRLLIDLGAVPTDESRDSASRVSAEHELRRPEVESEAFRAQAAAVDTILQALGATGAAPVERHDGISPIAAPTGSAAVRHQILWHQLVPDVGPAATLQGEVVRLAGRVIIEVDANGRMNWGKRYRALLTALLEHLAEGTPLPEAELAEAQQVAKRIDKNRESDDDHLALLEFASSWVERNPDPVPLPPPTTYDF